MSSGWLTALQNQGLNVASASDVAVVPGWLDTGNYALNWAISGRLQRGYPMGHTIEIFGDPSTGKSFLITLAIVRAQAQKGVVLLDDTEGAYNLDWIERLGVNTKHLGYEHSDTVKDHLDLAMGFVAAYTSLSEKGKVKGPGLLICDSLAELSTQHELEVQLEKKDMSKAAELKAFFRIFGGKLHGTQMVHLSTNHVIANIGNMWDKRTTSGGGGPKYQSSVRLDLRGASKLKADNGEYIGVRTRVFVDKNRITTPWREVYLSIPFYQPISRASGLIPVLLQLGFLTEDGHMLRYRGKKLGLRTYKDRKKLLRQDEEAEKLLDKVPELLDEVDEELASVVATPLTSAHMEDEEEVNE